MLQPLNAQDVAGFLSKGRRGRRCIKGPRTHSCWCLTEVAAGAVRRVLPDPTNGDEGRETRER